MMILILFVGDTNDDNDNVDDNNDYGDYNVSISTNNENDYDDNGG
jgi:hypothetical protein